MQRKIENNFIQAMWKSGWVIKNWFSDLFSNSFYSGKLTRKDLYDLIRVATTESFFSLTINFINKFTEL